MLPMTPNHKCCEIEDAYRVGLVAVNGDVQCETTHEEICWYRVCFTQQGQVSVLSTARALHHFVFTWDQLAIKCIILTRVLIYLW